MADNEGVFDYLTGTLKKTASAGLGLAGNLLQGSMAVSAYSDALSNNTELLGEVGKAISGLVKFAEGSLKEYQQLTSIGATFGTSIVDIRQSAAEMGMEVKEMTEFFMSNMGALRVLGSTTEDATQAFIQMSKDFLDSDFGTQLRMLGYDVQDINETLATFADLQSVEAMKRMRTDGTLNANAAEFAVTLDELSKLTGKQRDAIAEEMAQRRRDGQVQAILSTLSEDSQMALQEGLQTASSLGPGFEALIQDLVAFGAPVSDQAKAVAKALPEVMDEFSAYAAAVKGGASPEQAQALLDDAIGASIEGMSTPEFAQKAILANFSDVGATSAEMLESSYELRRAMQSAQSSGQSISDVLAQTRSNISDQQQQQIDSQGLIQQTVAMQEALRETVMFVQQTALPSIVEQATSALNAVTEHIGDAESLREQVASAISQVLTPIQETDPFNFLENMFSDLTSVPIETDEVVFDENTAGALADSLGLAVDEQISENDVPTATSMDEQFAASNEAIAEARTALAAAEENLARLEEAASEAIIRNNTEANAVIQDQITAARSQVVEAEANLQNAINRSVEQIQQYTLSQVDRYNRAQAGMGTFSGGFDSGGNIPNSGFGIVGERGPEIITGSNGITGRVKSIDIMNRMINAAKSIPNNIEVEEKRSPSNISSNEDMMQELRRQSKSIDQLVETMYRMVDINGEQLYTERKTQRITKGLNGNLLKGVAR